MKIGILGTGVVGHALGGAFIELGHEVMMSSREAGNAKATAWAEATGSRASQGSFADAAGYGEVLVLATLGAAVESAVRMAGIQRFTGKILIDTTNPLDFSGGMSPKLTVGHTDSAGEQVQRLLPEARVVKAFNTVGHAHMFRPQFPGGPPDMFIGGNDDQAKALVAGFIEDFGWNVVDLGGIEAARWLEPMCLVWVVHGIRSGSWDHAFKLLRK